VGKLPTITHPLRSTLHRNKIFLKNPATPKILEAEITGGVTKNSMTT
jgi:hypothetical protein